MTTITEHVTPAVIESPAWPSLPIPDTADANRPDRSGHRADTADADRPNRSGHRPQTTDTSRADRTQNRTDIGGGIDDQALVGLVVPVHDRGIAELALVGDGVEEVLRRTIALGIAHRRGCESSQRKGGRGECESTQCPGET